MSWILWEGWISIAYFKIEYQDQCPRNTLQIALDRERRLIIHHNIDFLGLQLEWIDILWMIGEFGDKMQKNWEDLTRLGRVWIDMSWNLGRSLKTYWTMNNSVCGRFFNKLSPYYIHNPPISKVIVESEEIWFYLFRKLFKRGNPSSILLSYIPHLFSEFFWMRQINGKTWYYGHPQPTTLHDFLAIASPPQFLTVYFFRSQGPLTTRAPLNWTHHRDYNYKLILIPLEHFSPPSSNEISSPFPVILP